MQEGLDYTLFRPFNWIGSGLDSIDTAKEGSSRVITQFLGHIVRGEAIKLVDGGTQKRAFTYIDDGTAALMKIVANANGVASGRIYNIGNPANNWSVRELATRMLEIARRYPEYAASAARVTLVDTTHRGLLWHRLPGRAEPRAQDRQHHARPRLEAAGVDGRRPRTHLRGISRSGGGGTRAHRVRRVRTLLRAVPPTGHARHCRCTSPSRWTWTHCAARAKACRGSWRILRRHAVTSPPFFSRSAPDHTGRAIKRVFRPGFVGKVRRTSVVKHYGVRTLLYGTVLPGPDIGRRGAEIMQSVRDAGHETGIHCWDHIRWQDGVAQADAEWTLAEMERACARYTDIFREPPRTHGAAGWQMNVHALRLTQRLGFDYCSDGRGTHPHLPMYNAEPIRCPQIPTTLPTLDELVGLDGVTEGNVAAHLLERTRDRRCRRSTRCMPSSRACAWLQPSSSSSSAGRRRAGRSSRCVRSTNPWSPWPCPLQAGAQWHHPRPQRHAARAGRGVPGRDVDLGAAA